MTIYGDEAGLTHPKRVMLDRWLSGGTPEVKRLQPDPVLPGRDLYGPRPEVQKQDENVQSVLGAENFVQPKAPRKSRRKRRRMQLWKVARMLDRKTQQVWQWTHPPGGPSGESYRFRRKLPPCHRYPSGKLFFYEDEVTVIMDWARREGLIVYDEEGTPHKKSVTLTNFSARVTDAIESIRAANPCTCGGCVPPLKSAGQTRE